MFVFGHLGIGSGLVLLARRDLPLGSVLTGTLLPDLVDKTLFYGLVRTRVLPEAACAWLPGTRTVGHTLIAAALVAIASLFATGHARRGLVGAALGMASHDALDVLSDILTSGHLRVPFTLSGSSAWRASLFPLAGTPFSVSVSIDCWQHFLAALKLHLTTEILGASLLGVALYVAHARRAAPVSPVFPVTTERSGSEARG